MPDCLQALSRNVAIEAFFKQIKQTLQLADLLGKREEENYGWWIVTSEHDGNKLRA
jgi:hypothetical protein